MKRLTTGGRINRDTPVTMCFDGRDLPGFEGDTLASALLAAGHKTVGRSFKYHRRRGVYSAGVEEPNAMVTLHEGAFREPNTRATCVEAQDGLVAASQNAWPSIHLDIGAVNNLLSPFFSAGFYYKTFIGPFSGTGFWMWCERFIRRASGMGRAVHLPDPDTYEKVTTTCDVLVIGGGAAGLSAALAAGRKGARVILAEQDTVLGGAILSDPVGGESDFWLKQIELELHTLPNIRILTRASVFGAYDSDTYGMVEHLSGCEGQPRQRYWQIHAPRAVMATGAIERPMVFGNNDLPGVMLAGAVRSYLNRFAVLAGQTALVATNNDSAYATAIDLASAGAGITVVDTRTEVPLALREQAETAGIRVLRGHAVIAARGRKCVTSALVAPLDQNGEPLQLACDLIAASAGWSPNVHLWSQLYKTPEYRPESACFIPRALFEAHLQPAGLVTAPTEMAQIITDGFARGSEAAGPDGDAGTVPESFDGGPLWSGNFGPVWCAPGVKGKAFVDLQHDVKLSDIDQAHLEGYVSVEHLKRYTTTGMATDQGKLSNVNALARMADLQEREIAEAGTTTFRPPFTPVTIGALVGQDHGAHVRPTRRTPIHGWHVAQGAALTEAGLWKRAWYYPQGDEDVGAAYRREAAHVRAHIGLVDVSTLGKIAVQGPDAATFLNRVYTNGWRSLRPGRIRYGVMLREDGIVLDDGATARLGEHEYFMTTTTANAAKILADFERRLQSDWRDLKVHVTSLTDQFAAMALAGPKSRALLQTLCPDVDLSPEALPNNSFVEATIAEHPVRLHRMSFSGELAYEIYTPSGHGEPVWQAIMTAGAPHRIIAYGTESMGTLRIEKGHVAGPELDGRTTIEDLGLAGLASSKKPFVGSVLRHRPLLQSADRAQLVGLLVEGDEGARGGSLIFAKGAAPEGHGEGWVTSTTYSPALGKYIAMAFVKNGQARLGEEVQIVNLLENQTSSARLISHHFFDPEGERQNG